MRRGRVEDGARGEEVEVVGLKHHLAVATDPLDAVGGDGGGGREDQPCRFTISMIAIGANGEMQPFEHG